MVNTAQDDNLVDDDNLTQDDSRSLTGGAKEAEPKPVKKDKGGEVKIEQVGEEEKVPEAVEGWVERVERGEDVHLAKPVEYKGEKLVESSNLKNPKIELPLTKDSADKGLKTKIGGSLRWLAEWCVMLVKKLPEKIIYKR